MPRCQLFLSQLSVLMLMRLALRMLLLPRVMGVIATTFLVVFVSLGHARADGAEGLASWLAWVMRADPNGVWLWLGSFVLVLLLLLLVLLRFNDDAFASLFYPKQAEATVPVHEVPRQREAPSKMLAKPQLKPPTKLPFMTKEPEWQGKPVQKEGLGYREEAMPSYAEALSNKTLLDHESASNEISRGGVRPYPLAAEGHLTLTADMPTPPPLTEESPGAAVALLDIGANAQLRCIEGLCQEDAYTLLPHVLTYIGRNSRISQILVRHAKVSRAHCLVEYDPDKGCVWLQDNTSLNGTFVIGKGKLKSGRRAPLYAGDRFYVHPTRAAVFEVQLPAQTTAESTFPDVEGLKSLPDAESDHHVNPEVNPEASHEVSHGVNDGVNDGD